MKCFVIFVVVIGVECCGLDDFVFGIVVVNCK